MKYFKRKKENIPDEINSSDLEIYDVVGTLSFFFDDQMPGSQIIVSMDDGSRSVILDLLNPVYFSTVLLLGSNASEAYENYCGLTARKRLIVINDLHEEVIPYADSHSSFFADLHNPVTGLRLDPETDQQSFQIAVHAVNAYRKAIIKNLFDLAYDLASKDEQQGQSHRNAIKAGMAKAKKKRQQDDASFQYGAKKGDKHVKAESIPLTEFIIRYSKYFSGSLTDQEITDSFNSQYLLKGLDTTRSTVNRYKNNLLKTKQEKGFTDDELLSYEILRYEKIAESKKNHGE